MIADGVTAEEFDEPDFDEYVDYSEKGAGGDAAPAKPKKVQVPLTPEQAAAREAKKAAYLAKKEKRAKKQKKKQELEAAKWAKALKKQQVENERAAELAVGERVFVKGYCEGTIRFIGDHKSDETKGVRVLVELDEPLGKNNGIVADQVYVEGSTFGENSCVLTTPKKIYKEGDERPAEEKGEGEEAVAAGEEAPATELAAVPEAAPEPAPEPEPEPEPAPAPAPD
jgi:hypothetical protein